MDDIASALGIDPIELRRKNWVGVGDPLDIVPRLGERGGVDDVATRGPAAGHELWHQECVAQATRAIGWERRNDPSWRQPPDRPHIRRGIGMRSAMQGSGIPFVDMGAASIKINDDGSFNLLVGATDLGTGADTVLAQIVAEVLGVPLDDIIVYSSDTDITPFDVGAYASSTTYVSGMAVKKAAEAGRARIVGARRELLELDDPGSVELHDRRAWAPDGRSVSLGDIALNSLHTEDQEQIMGTASHFADSRRRSVRGAARRGRGRRRDRAGDRDQARHRRRLRGPDQSGHCERPGRGGDGDGPRVRHYRGARPRRCGPARERPLRAVLDLPGGRRPEPRSILVQTMEPSGPFGAKAVGEVPMDGIAPAVRNAILNATGVGLTRSPHPRTCLAGDARPRARAPLQRGRVNQLADKSELRFHDRSG